MRVSEIINEGAYVVKNKDGAEKRFKDADSAEAKAWKESSSKKAKPEKYSQEYWDAQADKMVRPLPWTKLTTDYDVTNEITNIVKDQFGDIEFDWTFGQAGAKIRDGVECATVKVRVMYEIRPEHDLGVSKPTSDSQVITVGRNPKNPKKIDFLGYA